MSNFLDFEIQYLQGVGPKRGEILKKELNINSVRDLFFHFPYRYIDRSQFYTIHDILPSMPYVQIKGRFLRAKTIGEFKRQRLVAQFSDGQSVIELVWFKSIKWVRDAIHPNVEYVVFGKPTEYNGTVTIIHPEFEPLQKFITQTGSSIQAMYNTSEKMKNANITSKTILNLQRTIASKIQNIEIAETLPEYLLEKLKLPGLKEALFTIHFPENFAVLERAQYRIKFEEFFFIQLQLISRKLSIKREVAGHLFERKDKYLKDFMDNHIPFKLTGAQVKVLREIRQDMMSGKQMNRLIQGDVGSGKTLVAFISILMAIDNGYQTCLMAPTEILANQHFNSLLEYTREMGVNMALLTGSTKKKDRVKIHEQLQNGELQLIVGTHALIENEVQFMKLGLSIIDEQHRFGVAQRAKLWEKSYPPPHVLIMTATPIPRTLALTLYGDLDISVIDELPPGRKPIKTILFNDSHRDRLFGFMKEQIKAGRQIYVVYPLIKESEKMDYKDLEDGFEAISRAFPMPQYQVSVVHGKMKAADKDFSMNLFAKGQTQIMVATTVIEVGVNVPNASVMVIESAERFGLSQLHQLRGRVGRGAEQSFCILMSSYKLSEDGRKRLETMVRTNDGFEISEVDLKLRGFGELDGTKQSGDSFQLKLANIAKDSPILEFSREIASNILKSDPNLESSENQRLKNHLLKLTNSTPEWGKIS